MKLKMSAVIMDMDDEPVVSSPGDEELTLRKVCVQALLAPLPEDAKLDGEKRLRLYNLASKCQTVDDLELKSDDVAFIKDRVMRTYGTLVYGRVDELMEGKASSGD